MTEEQYLSLCEKYLNGTCTLQEELLIKDYQEKSGMVNDEWDSKQMGDQDRIRLLLQHKLQQSMQPSQVRVVSFNRWWWYAAAAILLFITAGGYFISTVKTNQAYTAASPVKKTNTEIQPGSNKAVLTLANGKRITLDSAGNGLLSRAGWYGDIQIGQWPNH
jgi:transmembrane sensor